MHSFLKIFAIIAITFIKFNINQLSVNANIIMLKWLLYLAILINFDERL